MLHRLRVFLGSSIGRKFVMSLTGAGLIGFALAHLAGNLTLFADGTGASFDAYASVLAHNPLLPVAEVGLTVMFVVHIALAVRVTLDNREARKQRYKLLEAHGERSMASVTMIVTGLLIGVFLVVHLLDFRLGNNDPDGMGGRVVERLSGGVGAAIYAVGVLALGLHVWHAFQSLFQSLGFNHPRYRLLVQRAGWVAALVMGLGFGAFPFVIQVMPDSFGQAPGESVQADSEQADAAHSEEQER